MRSDEEWQKEITPFSLDLVWKEARKFLIKVKALIELISWLKTLFQRLEKVRKVSKVQLSTKRSPELESKLTRAEWLAYGYLQSKLVRQVVLILERRDDRVRMDKTVVLR